VEDGINLFKVRTIQRIIKELEFVLDDVVSIVIKVYRYIVTMVTSLLWIRMVMSIASDSDTSREDMSNMSASSTDGTE
jgi:hypothetical protein